MINQITGGHRTVAPLLATKRSQGVRPEITGKARQDGFVRFGHFTSQEVVLAFLDRKYSNQGVPKEEFKVGEILNHFIKHAVTSDGKTGPDSYPTPYLQHLDKDLSIKDDAIKNTIMKSFVDLHLFAKQKRRIPWPIRKGDQAAFEKVKLTPFAYEMARIWQEAQAPKPLPDATKMTASAKQGVEYAKGPVDLSTRNYDDALRMIPHKPEVDAQIRKKLDILKSGDRIEGAKVKSWLQTAFSLPWLNETKDKANIKEAKKIFDERFYGMEVLKERLLDEVAVRNAKGGNKGGILLLVGPPGTGKTAVTSTLADVMGRKFVRISLAGISDAHKITGHDYTYVGSKHGLIIDAMIRAGSMNPVIQIDEMDKVGQHSAQGNPLDALLAVLDPQQNDKFTDTFLDFPFDLSKVLFVCTANKLEDFPAPLLSRTEVIYFDSYLPEEKLEIATKYLIPKQYKEYNITSEQIRFEPKAIEHIIKNYTLEGGVRKLEQRIQDIFRKSTRYLQEHPQTNTLIVTPELADKWLTNPILKEGVDATETRVGVVNGLYYSEAGGGILPVQVSVSPGRGNLSLTGHLGEVMQESAKVALSFIKRNAKELGLDDDTLQNLKDGNVDVHIHYPDGATKKDGPSAGITTFLALWSGLTGNPIPSNIAMTGELDLQGNVKRIGGVLEKVSGAIAQGVGTIYLPANNRKDFDDLCKRSEIFSRMAQSRDIKFIRNAQELIADLMPSKPEVIETPVVAPETIVETKPEAPSQEPPEMKAPKKGGTLGKIGSFIKNPLSIFHRAKKEEQATVSIQQEHYQAK